VKQKGHVAGMEMRTAHRIPTDKPEEKRPLVRLQHRLKNNIKTYLQKLDWRV
jgi:hypothetical protein